MEKIMRYKHTVTFLRRETGSRITIEFIHNQKILDYAPFNGFYPVSAQIVSEPTTPNKIAEIACFEFDVKGW